MHLFVYYKFVPSDYPNIESVARQLLAQVQEAVPSVKAQLLRRPDVNDKGEHTWMETYECEAACFEGLKAAVEQLASQLPLPTARRVEVFLAV